MKYNFKKIIPAVSITAILATSTIAFAEYNPNKITDNTIPATKITTTANKVISIKINDSVINEKAYENGDKTILPVRAVAEALGYEVGWIAETETITLTKGAQYITFNINNDGYTFARTAPVLLGTAPQLVDGLTYVPVQLFSEIMDLSVKVEEGEIIISEDKIEEDVVENEDKFNAEITSIEKEGKNVQIFVNDTQKGEVGLNVSDEIEITDEEGNKLSIDDLSTGNKVFVEYSEAMTMSLPPINNPLKIQLISVEDEDNKEEDVVENEDKFNAEITSIEKEGKNIQIFVNDTQKGEVRLNVSDEIEITDEEGNKLSIDDLSTGNKVFVEYSEAMTMSLPPINNPLKIQLISVEDEDNKEEDSLTIEGSISEVTELGQLVIKANKNTDTSFEEVIANITDDTKIVDKKGNKLTKADLKEGTEVTVKLSPAMTRSIPPQSNAFEVVVK